VNHNGRVFLGQPSEERGNTHPASISLLQGELLDRQLSFMSSNASFLFIAHLAAPGTGRGEPGLSQPFDSSKFAGLPAQISIPPGQNSGSIPTGMRTLTHVGVQTRRTALQFWQLQDYKSGLLDGSTEVLE